MANAKSVLIAAGGTGGHVFPALAVASELKSRQIDVQWVGTEQGIEARIVPEHGILMHWMTVKGVRGKGILTKLLLPIQLLKTGLAAYKILKAVQPVAVLGLGGFVSGPVCAVAILMRIPVVIHEQNAVSGMTNRYLARFSDKVLESVKGTFPKNIKAQHTGNPVRKELFGLQSPEMRLADQEKPLKILVVGGSLGAQVLNETVPAALALLDGNVEVRHQTGKNKHSFTEQAYQSAGVEGQLSEFISDMSEAYQQADLVICRAGATTCAELSAIGVGAILVPYPYAVDDHQTVNGLALSEAGAAILMPQSELKPETLAVSINSLIKNREKVQTMAKAAKSLAKEDAALKVALVVLEAGQ